METQEFLFAIYKSIHLIFGEVSQDKALEVTLKQVIGQPVLYSYKITPTAPWLTDFIQSFQDSDEDENPHRLVSRLNQALQLHIIRLDIKSMKDYKKGDHNSK